MRPAFSALLAAALVAASASVVAQSNPAGPAPQDATGFFPPKPGGDLSLSHTLPPEAYRPAAPVPAEAPAVPPAAPAASTAPLVVVVPASTEGQVDRAEGEARRAREEAATRAPAPINGAFTGLTDERDR